MKEQIKHCEKCKEPINMVIKIGNNERLVPIMCSCGKKEAEEQKHRLKQQELANKIEELIIQGVMDRQYLDNNFANDNNKNKKVSDICKKYVENWEEIKKRNVGLLFYGDVGRGKTFYACCIANELFKKNLSICITSLPKLLDTVTRFDEDSKKLLNYIKNNSLLVIDDFGVERETDFANEQIFKIMDDRLRTGLPTIITTNLSKEELETPKTLAQRRIYSRISEMCPVKLFVDNENCREQKANDKRLLAKKILLRAEQEGQ